MNLYIANVLSEFYISMLYLSSSEKLKTRESMIRHSTSVSMVINILH